MRYSHLLVNCPDTLEHALETLSDGGDDQRIISGGTDVAVYMKDGVLRERRLLDISRLKELDFVRSVGDTIEIGARTTFSVALSHPLVRRWAPLLALASIEVGSLQIRNLATIAGNVCNASPAGDSLPPLYAQGAAVALQSVRGVRRLPIEKFILGPRKTARHPDELLTKILVPKMSRGSSFFFRKLGLRSSQAISVVSVAAVWKGMRAAIAVGAAAPTVVRASAAERYVARHGVTKRGLDRLCLLVAEASSPITDIRGSAGYRRDAIEGLAYEGFYDCLGGGRGQ